jgi:hypothetical protein
VKKFLKQFLATLGLMVYMLASLTLYASAADPAPPPPTRLFPLAGNNVYGNLPSPTQGTATGQIAELTWGAVQVARSIIGAVAVVMAVYAGIRMVTAYGNEEVYSTQKRNLFYCVVGLAIVGLGGEVANIFAVSCPEPGSFTAPGQTTLSCTQGGFLKDPNAIVRASTLFTQRTKIVITFIKYLIGSVAVFGIIRNGFRMITQGSNEEELGKDKKNLMYSIAGLMLIIISDTAISQVFYKLDVTRYPGVGGAQPGVDAARGVQELVGITNYVVAFVGALAVGALVVGGIMYITARGDDANIEKAKRVITAALAGIILIFGAFAIVSTFISGSFGEPPAAETVEVGAPVST